MMRPKQQKLKKKSNDLCRPTILRKSHPMAQSLPKWQTKNKSDYAIYLYTTWVTRKLIELFLLVFFATKSRKTRNNGQENSFRVDDNLRRLDSKL